MNRELIVFCHLRWDFVWQRPQHLVSRLARHFDRVIVFEEPRPNPDNERPTLRRATSDGVTRMWLDVRGPDGHCGFDDPRAADYPALAAEQLADPAIRTAWLYTPLALPLVERIAPDLIVYDVMDDLSKFANASPQLEWMQRRCLQAADRVFTGGRSLQRLVASERPDAVCFPSGVETSHFAAAEQLRVMRPRNRPVAGYVGVIDERLDLDLLAGLSTNLPDWDIHMVGPVVKIDPASLPQSPNLHYVGPRRYDELPSVMAAFDVALMPFALNEATMSISPTKSLEYLAAGLPVVSTRVPDVVADLGEIVALADDAEGFAAACRDAIAGDAAGGRKDCRSILRWNQWDAIADRMHARMTSDRDTHEVAAGQ